MQFPSGDGKYPGWRKRTLFTFIGLKRAPDLVLAVLRHGTVEGEAQTVLKTSERTARNTLSKLTSADYLSSASPKSPVRLSFPLNCRERLFPTCSLMGTCRSNKAADQTATNVAAVFSSSRATSDIVPALSSLGSGHALPSR